MLYCFLEKNAICTGKKEDLKDICSKKRRKKKQVIALQLAAKKGLGIKAEI